MPSDGRNAVEGVTTRLYGLKIESMPMKAVQSRRNSLVGSARPAVVR